MKNESRNFFFCHISQHFDKRKDFFYFKINSVKSKRKKKISKNIKQATSVLKRKKCLLSPNKNNDL